MPSRIAALPTDERGFPIPFFTGFYNGKPEFRSFDRLKLKLCVRDHRCWVCGQQLGAHLAFTIGPMCAINRISGEPPSHRDCAVFSATACPFLTKPLVKRRVNDLPAEVHENPNHISRNPGTVMVWVTRRFEIVPNSDGSPLFRIGDPDQVLFFHEGRPARRSEVMESIDSGFPVLLEAARADPKPGAEQELGRRLRDTVKLVEVNAL